MRRQWRLIIALVALSALGWLVSRGVVEPSVSRVHDSSHVLRVSAGGLLQALAGPMPSTSHTSSRDIQGLVRGPHGPVAGVQLRASREVPGESLSKRPCASPPQGGAWESVLECQEFEHVSELVAQRQGEVPVLARTTSAEDGSFVLEGLEPGTYALWAEGAEGVAVLQDVEAGRQGVEMQLGAGVRMSGTVTGEGGAPLAGALVTALFTAHSRFFEALSDGTGHFTLGTLPRGEYVLLASHEGWLPAWKQASAYSSTMESTLELDRPRRVSGRVTREGTPMEGAQVHTETSPANGHEVLTDASGHFVFEGLSPRTSHEFIATQGELGARVWVDFKDPEGGRNHFLAHYPEVSLELKPVTQVRGHVLDAARRPVAGVRVFLEEKTGGFYSNVARTQTDAEGRYALGPVPPGTMRLVLSARGRQVPEPAPWSDFPAGTLERELLLSPEYPVEGTLVDASDRPLANVRMVLLSPAGPKDSSTGDGLEERRLGLQMRRVFGETGPEGHFLLYAPAPGHYELLIEDERVLERSTRHPVIAPGSLRLAVALRPQVVGEVVDETGAPVFDVEVSLWPEERTRDTDQLSWSGTDKQGRFSLPAPAAGRYLLSAGFQQEGLARSVSQSVVLGEGDTRVRLRLAPGHALSGVVVDGRGQPLEGASVELLSSNRVRRVRDDSGGGGGPDWREHTGPDGRFSFPSVSGEALELEVSKPGYGLRTRADEPPRNSLPLEPGARDVRVVLVREAVVHGRLVRTDGSPLTWFFVNGAEQESESGEFSWPIYGTGTLQLELCAPELLPGVAPVRRSVPVREEEDLELGTIVLGGP